MEEFVEGHEGFYDTVSIDGRAALDFVSHYYPNVLEAMRTRWISPQFVSTNRVESVADYQQLREMGQRVNEALGIGTSATHMEWFFGPKGLRFSEIGCRPPGVGAWDLYSAGNDIDLYREWANAIVHDHVAAQPSRRFATGIVALRPGPGRHDQRLLRGRRRSRAGYGEWVIDAHLPDPGTPTQPSRPATWPTPTSGCATPTTTRCAGCSTTSAARCTCTPRERVSGRRSVAGVPEVSRVIVLGPQRRPTVAAVADGLPADRPIATVTAGWQDREREDAELDRLLDGRTVNLRLHARWQDVLERDPPYAAAEREHRAARDERQELYRVQLAGAPTSRITPTSVRRVNAETCTVLEISISAAVACTRASAKVTSRMPPRKSNSLATTSRWSITLRTPYLADHGLRRTAAAPLSWSVSRTRSVAGSDCGRTTVGQRLPGEQLLVALVGLLLALEAHPGHQRRALQVWPAARHRSTGCSRSPRPKRPG